MTFARPVGAAVRLPESAIHDAGPGAGCHAVFVQ
jgi:hypothetical protein